MLRHAPIRSKVVAILTLPLVGLIALAAVGIGTTLARGAEAGRRNDLAQLAVRGNTLVHELQAERTLSSDWVAARPSQAVPRDGMLAQRVVVDRTASALEQFVGRLDADAYDPRVRQALDRALGELRELQADREVIDIGAWLRDEYERAGMPFDPAAVRVSRLQESLQLLKGLLAGPALTFKGEHYTVDGIIGVPVPVQRPHPPILVGAGSRRMLGIAGREADIVGILPRALPEGAISGELSERSPHRVARKVEWVEQAAEERSRQVELSMVLSVALGGDHRQAAERLAVQEGWGAAAGELVLEMPSVAAGPADRVAEELQVRRDRYGFSYLVVADGDMETFAPVVDRLAGR